MIFAESKKKATKPKYKKSSDFDPDSDQDDGDDIDALLSDDQTIDEVYVELAEKASELQMVIKENSFIQEYGCEEERDIFSEGVIDRIKAFFEWIIKKLKALKNKFWRIEI